jgi:hypothetical protein
MQQIEEDFYRAEVELVCPWCHTHSINAIVNHNTLRLKCSECRMDAFVTRIPPDKKLSDYNTRRMIP